MTTKLFLCHSCNAFKALMPFNTPVIDCLYSGGTTMSSLYIFIVTKQFITR